MYVLLVLLMTKQTLQNKTGLSIPVNINASKRKEGKEPSTLNQNVYFSIKFVDRSKFDKQFSM